MNYQILNFQKTKKKLLKMKKRENIEPVELKETEISKEIKPIKIETPKVVKQKLAVIIQALNKLEQDLNILRKNQQDIVETLLAVKEVKLEKNQYLDLDNNLNILIKQRKNEQK